MNDICGISRISPRWGFRFRNDLYRRAFPYADDFGAFSPVNQKAESSLTINSVGGQRPMEGYVIIKNATKLKAESLSINSVGQHPTERNEIIKNTTKQKAESLIINSVGQRPTERNMLINKKPQRGVISKNN